MYSEMLVAHLLRLVRDRYGDPAAVDAAAARPIITVGRIAGPHLGYPPTDAALAWEAVHKGEPAGVGTRAAVHLLGDGRCALGLGRGRGLVECGGDRLVHLTTLHPGRYESAWYLPGVYYGGLI